MGLERIAGKLGTYLFGASKGLGKQIGKVSKSGLITFEKTVNGGKVYTTIEKGSGKVVRTKKINEFDHNREIFCYDGKNNLTSHTAILKEPTNFGLASKNQFADKTRIIKDEYNRFGQTVHHSDTVLSPMQNKLKLKMSQNKDGQYSMSWFNTNDFTQRWTVRCVE